MYRLKEIIFSPYSILFNCNRATKIMNFNVHSVLFLDNSRKVAMYKNFVSNNLPILLPVQLSPVPRKRSRNYFTDNFRANFANRSGMKIYSLILLIIRNTFPFT